MTAQADNLVPPETILYRRVLPHLNDGYVRDKNRDCFRISSAVFQKREMSVVLGDTLADEKRSPDEALGEHSEFFLVSITAADAEDHDQEVRRTPLDNEPAHGDVVGEKPQKLRRSLSKRAKWVIGPEGHCPDPE